MRKIFFCILSFALFSISAEAQIARIEEFIKEATEEANKGGISKKDSLAVLDSLKILELNQELQQMRLNEMMYVQELEQARHSALYDSVKKAQHRLRIDSLRNISKGAPLVIEGDTLFKIYASQGGISFMERAKQTKKIIEELGSYRTIKPNSINILSLDNVTEIMYEGRVIASITTDDAIWMNTARDSLALIYKVAIIAKIKTLQQKNSTAELTKRVGLFVGIILLLLIIFSLLKRYYRKLRLKIIEKARKKLKPVTIRGYEFLDATSQARIILFGLSIVFYALIIIQLIIAIPVLFSIFPQTKSIASKLFGYIFIPIKSIVLSIVEYIPNLFTIIIICLAIRYLLRGLKYLSGEIERKKIRIIGFYPDWAKPTFIITRFLLYAFMIALIYPYLPGSDSEVFQGISVFVGLIISLGSSTIIANIIAGFVITYMRPFIVGDRIKINDIVGNVTEKTTFVTRVLTPKNEIITIPNSSIISSNTTNYSSSARKHGLILHTNVGIGYNVPWQKAHSLLIEAAKRTDGVVNDMEPFVLEASLEESCPIYQLNVFVKDANLTAKIYSDLHTNIQQLCKEANIDLEIPMVYSQKGGVKEGTATN